MKHQIKVFSQYLSTVPLGDTFLDKLAIWYFTMKTPIHFLMRKLKIPHSYKLFRNVTLDFGAYKIYCGNFISNVYMASPFFESEIKEYFHVKMGNTFIDIGANVGKYSLMIAAHGANVLAIEAEASNYANLRESVVINKFEDRLFPLNVACNDKPGYLQISMDKLDNGSGTVSATVRRNWFSGFVPCDTLDNIVEVFEVKKIELIKIDVEGAEESVIAGGLKTIEKFKPRIIFETWSKVTLERVEKTLAPLGYTFKEIMPENYYGVCVK